MNTDACSSLPPSRPQPSSRVDVRVDVRGDTRVGTAPALFWDRPLPEGFDHNFSIYIGIVQTPSKNVDEADDPSKQPILLTQGADEEAEPVTLRAQVSVRRPKPTPYILEDESMSETLVPSEEVQQDEHMSGAPAPLNENSQDPLHKKAHEANKPTFFQSIFNKIPFVSKQSQPQPATLALGLRLEHGKELVAQLDRGLDEQDSSTVIPFIALANAGSSRPSSRKGTADDAFELDESDVHRQRRDWNSCKRQHSSRFSVTNTTSSRPQAPRLSSSNSSSPATAPSDSLRTSPASSWLTAHLRDSTDEDIINTELADRQLRDEILDAWAREVTEQRQQGENVVDVEDMDANPTSSDGALTARLDRSNTPSPSSITSSTVQKDSTAVGHSTDSFPITPPESTSASKTKKRKSLPPSDRKYVPSSPSDSTEPSPTLRASKRQKKTPPRIDTKYTYASPTSSDSTSSTCELLPPTPETPPPPKRKPKPAPRPEEMYMRVDHSFGSGAASLPTPGRTRAATRKAARKGTFSKVEASVSSATAKVKGQFSHWPVVKKESSMPQPFVEVRDEATNSVSQMKENSTNVTVAADGNGRSRKKSPFARKLASEAWKGRLRPRSGGCNPE